MARPGVVPGALAFGDRRVLRVRVVPPGIGITACRYALDGPDRRVEHRETVALPDGRGRAPDAWREGASADLPAAPDIDPVAPEDAPPHVAAVYDRLTAELDTTEVNTVFQAYGADPAFLTAAVEAQLEAGLPDATVTRRLHGACAAALDADDAPGGLKGVADADRETVSERLAAYHENLATLLVTLYVETRLVG